MQRKPRSSSETTTSSTSSTSSATSTTSWDLLMPTSPPLTRTHSCPNPTPTPQAPLSPAIANLEQISRYCVTVTNAHFPSPTSLLAYITPHISPSWAADFDGFPAETSFPRHFYLHLHIMRSNPEYSASVLNVTTIADEAEGWADVMMLLEVKGRPRGTRRQTLVVLRWKRGWEGQWKWVHLSSMRGIGSIFGEVAGAE
ncbi:hypothetical protein M409DRAFT_16523 [Zasmidium cellare ATCC 36951]|uniref:SnoaL-like domain-containing protein n=1 Tax=Zasmidium cellare ATCC 36951 TaxID=1080233 RepID=A0A6A6D7U7_ZASCE|nr:uncharacterized protein M409DRAFT_16523 [Zasmidium cellare ATCC 36951]KAF2174259.1 hypothetical protein M409DRAFT_16523 [Zasmidium cellare ATCC 36951]